jgi:hypothetical protein
MERFFRSLKTERLSYQSFTNHQEIVKSNFCPIKTPAFSISVKRLVIGVSLNKNLQHNQSILAGNDTLVGNAGSDTLTGGLGSDTFDYNSNNDGHVVLM